MKKIILYLLVVFLCGVAGVVKAQMPWDIAYQAMPVSITIDIPEEISQVAGNLQSTVSQGKQIVMQTKADITSLKSAVVSTFNKIKSGAIFGGSGNDGEIGNKFCGRDLKSVDVKEISDKITNIFLTYESETLADETAVNVRRKKFYIDNLYVIYAASVVLRQKLENEIKPTIEVARKCAEGDGAQCGIPSSDEGGNNEELFSYGKTLETMDSVVRLWETVAALKARLAALDVIDRITPQYKVTGAKNNSKEIKDKTAFLYPKATSIIKNKDAMAFAQISFKGIANSLSKVEAEAIGTKNKSTELITKSINFTSPSIPDTEHPLLEATDKLAALSDVSAIQDVVNRAIGTHNMMGQLDEYKAMAEQYAEMKKDYEAALDKLYRSEQCGIKYLSRYFSDPIKAWSGNNLGKNNYRHDLRKGISGWALEAFETVKAAETSSVTSDDVAQISLDEETLKDLSDDPDFSKAKDKGQQTKSSLSKSKQEQNQEENRKSSLQSWQVGAEAAKMLGENPSKWGTPTSNKMIWNDAKNFYNQYLRRKYDNVKKYLKSYTRNDILALVAAKLTGDNQDISETNYQKQIKKASQDASLKIRTSMEEATQSIEDQNIKDKSVQASLDEKRKDLIAKMDEISALINDSSNKISDIRSTAKDQAFQQIDNAINAKVVFPTSGATAQSPAKISGSASLEKAIEGQNNANTDDEEIARLEKQLISDQNKLDNYQKQLEELDAEIAEAKQLAQEGFLGASAKSSLALANIKDELEATLQKGFENYASDVGKNIMAILTEKAKKNPLINPIAMIPLMEVAADVALNSINKQVDNIVDDGYQDLLSMGDSLYSPSSHARVVEIHNQMINKIKAITITYTVAGLINVRDIAVYAKLASADTNAEQEGFFVGAPAKERDLKAPFSIPNFALPPVREVFHFDAIDFANVKPSVKGKFLGRKIPASDFLNFGGDVPEVWQHMLKDNAFIETSYDLKEALNLGCEEVAFSRGGIMPCVVKGTNTVVDVIGNGKYIKRTDISPSGLSECLLIDTKKGRPNHTFWNEAVDFSSPIVIVDGKPKDMTEKPNCKYSELGMILDADENNNLSFKPRSFEVYSLLLKDTGTKKLSKKDKNELAAANHAILSRNQIGDFLRHAENEKLNRENLEEYKQKYDDQINKLKEKLSEFGFTPSDDMDLAKESDYNLVFNKLNSIKKQQISEAKASIVNIDINDNAPAQERKVMMEKLISIMEKDDKALLNLSMLSAEDDAIEEKLKKAKADAAVVDKYKKSLKEQYKDYNNSDEAFCANY